MDGDRPALSDDTKQIWRRDGLLSRRQIITDTRDHRDQLTPICHTLDDQGRQTRKHRIRKGVDLNPVPA